ncbi:stress response protein SCP2 [Streptomyces sp. 846.5]|nr:VWA domain-containing protein [Streptomyces sp. 846.5]TDU01942.1 stress response protein SCP2 [Streptomyces sp. 846.5]
MTELLPGANVPVPLDPLTLVVRWSSGSVLDASAVLVGAAGKVRTDADLVFYNQPEAEGGAVRHQGGAPGRQTLLVQPQRLPADVERVVIAASLDDGSFAEVRDLALELHDAGGAITAVFPVRTAGKETLLLLGEVYRRQGGWRLRALGQGYDTGLAGLAADFGVTVDEQPPSTGTAPQSAAAPAADPVSLRKEIVRVNLAKRGAAGVRARIALVLDRSGSMRPLYNGGTVGRLVERMAPVAAVMDDDGSLDAWIFADHCARLPALRIPEMAGWIRRNVYIRSGHRQLPELPGGRLRPDHLVDVFGGNNEPEVIRDILAYYAERPGDPVLVLFFSDGGINRSRQIQELLTEAASRPLFWQFIGLGKSEYGILEQFDTLPGRVVDNAGFFQVDDFDRITDAELYDRLLSEFPQWLVEARRLGIA